MTEPPHVAPSTCISDLLRPKVYGNLNAPRAVAYSGVIYCLRCMVGHDIPLNQGCLKPVTIDVRLALSMFVCCDASVIAG